MKKYPEVAVIIPVYNEGGFIAGLVHELLPLFGTVICIDDGSGDNSLAELRKTDADVLSHLANIGQGGALETGIQYALKNQAIKYFLTFDADGQHGVDDAELMIKEMRTDAYDIILGSRFLKKNAIPPAKKVTLKLASVFTNLTTGLHLTDTHNGLRIFNRAFAEKVDLNNFGMAHSSEFLDLIKRYGFRFKEVPVTIVYTDYSRSKGQPLVNSVNILFDILFNKKE